jgi:RNA polymerase sigma-70 factor (ECF subfamily)
MALLNGDERAQLRAAQAGSASAFEGLFRAHWPRAYRAAYLLLLDQAGAEEIAEEAFLAAVRKLERFDEKRAFASWLHGTVVGAAADRSRSRLGRESFPASRATENTDPLGWEIPVAGPHTHPDVRAVALGLASLRVEERAAVVMRCILDYGPREIADLLEEPRSTTEAALERGLARLRYSLRERGELKDAELRALLLAQPVPGEHLAQERTWEVVRPVFAARQPARPGRRWPVKTTVFLALVAAGLAIGLTSAGSTIADWVQDSLGRDRVVTQPAAIADPRTLPGPGRLLVSGGGSLSVLGPSGARTPLGRYRGGSWATSGRFLAAWRPGELVGLDPAEPDLPLWTVQAKRIADARWSADDFRVAYRSGRSLRVVGGTGEDDRRIARGVAPVAPAWKPGKEHVLAYAGSDGRVRVVDVDARQTLWQVPVGETVGLAWSPDGTVLAVLTPRDLRLYQEPRALIGSVALPEAAEATALAAGPAAGSLAYAVFDPGSGSSSVVVVDPKTAASRVVFTGAGRIATLAWSPDGALVLVPWRAADQWLFVPADAGGAEVTVLPDVSATLGADRGFPRPDGWCCGPDAK